MADGVRSKNIFDPKAVKPFKMSHSCLENFKEVPCYHLSIKTMPSAPTAPSHKSTLNPNILVWLDLKLK